jgi:hypothetical protein
MGTHHLMAAAELRDSLVTLTTPAFSVPLGGWFR